MVPTPELHLKQYPGVMAARTLGPPPYVFLISISFASMADSCLPYLPFPFLILGTTFFKKSLAVKMKA